jgi:hypothetical protein
LKFTENIEWHNWEEEFWLKKRWGRSYFKKKKIDATKT